MLTRGKYRVNHTRLFLSGIGKCLMEQWFEDMLLGQGMELSAVMISTQYC